IRLIKLLIWRQWRCQIGQVACFCIAVAHAPVAVAIETDGVDHARYGKPLERSHINIERCVVALQVGIVGIPRVLKSTSEKTEIGPLRSAGKTHIDSI